MKVERMGKEVILTKEILRKMGQKKEPSKVIRGKILPYSSERLDTKSHVRFQ